MTLYRCAKVVDANDYVYIMAITPQDVGITVHGDRPQGPD